MAIWQGVNVNTGQVELPKYDATGVTTEVYVAAVGSTVAIGDTIIGPVIPAGVFLTDIVADVGKLDSGATPTIAFEVGYQNAGATVSAAFLATANTTAEQGGIAHANVGGVVGMTFTQNTTVIATITAAPATGEAGNFRLGAFYTATP